MENPARFYVTYANGTHRSFNRLWGFADVLKANAKVISYVLTSNSTGKKVSEWHRPEVALSAYLSEIGKKGGASKSEAKSKASAENGKKGGRPKAKKGEA